MLNDSYAYVSIHLAGRSFSYFAWSMLFMVVWSFMSSLHAVFFCPHPEQPGSTFLLG